MKIGKLPNKILKDIVINTLKPKRDEVLLRPEIGEDCTAFFLEDEVCVMSTDPITGATKNLGQIAVNIAVNDIASCGADPFGIMMTVLIPPDGDIDQLKEIMHDINITCDALNIDVLGGHTEVTDAVNRFVITATAVGRVKKNKLILTKNAEVNDALLMTKYAALEGTAILVNEKKEILSGYLSDEEIKQSLQFMEELSVLKEGKIAASIGVNSMHDITEGGVLGAVWELCNSCGSGAIIDFKQIPIREVTIKICDFLKMDPLKLISSGSMLISCNQNVKNRLIEELQDEGIKCTEIGVITRDKEIILTNGSISSIIEEPEADELYKVVL